VTPDNAVAITGIGAELPGLEHLSDLLSGGPLADGRAFEPAKKLGRRGLLYKDDATKLALCAVLDALGRAGLPAHDLYAVAPTGVAVSSNLGNVDTICRIIETLYAGSTADLSPMDVPNASSNVIASNIAIRFGCRSVTLTLCNGATSGVDALFVAANALKARRAERMIVVGVEPQNAFVQQLAAASLRFSDGRGPEDLPLGRGAACVILEPLAAAHRRSATIYGVIDGYAYAPAANGSGVLPPIPSTQASARPNLWFAPNQKWPRMRALSDCLHRLWADEPTTCDLSHAFGELYGALGVFQCVAACVWLQQQTDGRTDRLNVLATAGGSWGDGVASLRIGTAV